MRRAVITSLEGLRITAEETDGRITGLFPEKPEEASLVGCIYVGRVSHIVKSIRAAFVDIGRDTMCYYPLDEWEKYAAWQKNGASLHEGDEILLQIEKDAVKTKAPSGTGRLSFTGQYLVLMTGKQGLFFSSRIRSEERKSALKKLLEGKMKRISEKEAADFSYGIIVRTNGEAAPEDAVLSELTELLSEAKQIFSVWRTRTAGTLLYEPEPAFLSEIFNNRTETLEEAVTDDRAVYDILLRKKEAILAGNQSCHLPNIRFYEDSYPLYKLYSLETALSHALSKKVWLKSGGSLIIEPTEALVSIDVNTGKFDGKKNLEDTFFKTNLEAAAEIAVQLKLRNLSGIIIVDFIDMKEEGHREQLLSYFEAALKKDPGKTTVLGFTRLNLVELTRKKVRKPLHEVMSE